MQLRTWYGNLLSCAKNAAQGSTSSDRSQEAVSFVKGARTRHQIWTNGGRVEEGRGMRVHRPSFHLGGTKEVEKLEVVWGLGGLGVLVVLVG